jgi:hypothetical protein
MTEIIIILMMFSFALSVNAQARECIAPIIRYELSGGAGHYNYAPSFIQDDYGIIYGFLCQNRDPFKIVDYIYLYKGIPTPNGIKWQPGTEVLAPSDAPWDNCHVCDPDVREFHCVWHGETYNYIMTYLGVDQWDCNHNQIGLAVAKAIEGPWIKIPKPLIPYEDRTKWGVGQSTTIVKDSTTVQIFYHSTTDNGPYCMREVKLDDLDNIKLGPELPVPNLRSNSFPAFSKRYMYVVEEKRDYTDATIPTWVGNICSLSFAPISANILSKNNIWTEIGRVDPSLSHFPRNHNPGILTDTRGYIPDDNQLITFFTVSVLGPDWLWSYDLYSASYDLKKFFDNNNKKVNK